MINSHSLRPTPIWFYTILVLIPVLFVICIEIFLISINYGYNFNQWVQNGENKYIINPDIGKKYFASGSFVPHTIEDSFDLQKQENSYRVFVLGGSSAVGFPFNPMGSFSRYIRKRLELVYPQYKIEVVNIGMTAVNSYTLLDLLPGVLEQQPDLILIYAGHNEYYGALGVGSVYTYGSARTMNKLVLYLNNYRITQLVRNLIQAGLNKFGSGESVPSGTLMSHIAKDKEIVLNSEIFNSGLEQFKYNMIDLIEITKNQNIPIILGRLVCNLKDQKPFISYENEECKSADEIYSIAKKNYNDGDFESADSLFRLAKELDALRFRAPEKINHIIDELGTRYNIPVAQIDYDFASESIGGIVGENLMVDHLHPNVEGYQLMGRSFYEKMQEYKFLPDTNNIAITFSKQDSLTRSNFVFTKLDSVIGIYQVKLLKSDWPYTNKRTNISNFGDQDFHNLFKPQNFIDSLAMIRIQKKVTWVEAHLIGATYNLRNDYLKEYLQYMNVLIYQYPALKNLDFAINYFYEKNKITLSDFNPRRNGILALYLGNYKNAIKHLKEASKLNPNNSEILFNLSVAYLKIDDSKRALEIINRCLALDNDNYDALSLKEEIIDRLN